MRSTNAVRKAEEQGWDVVIGHRYHHQVAYMTIIPDRLQMHPLQWLLNPIYGNL